MGKKNSVWLDEDRVRKAFESATSVKDVLLALGEGLGSANYRAANLFAGRYGLELPKYVKNTEAAVASNRRSLEEILVAESDYSNRQGLKRRLIKEDLLEDKCYECNMGPVWNNKPIVLQLEHINGIGYDNRIENLSVLCPNCHSQTATFCNGNKVRYKNGANGLCSCGKPSKIGKCMTCAGLERRGVEVKSRQKIVWPELDELKQMVLDLGYSATGRKLGVSDNAVRKRLKTFDK
jgi:Zn finger protein HypA/HybF involved in hydrogenase expression